MSYSIRLDKVEDLKGGRKADFIANKIGITAEYLSYIFNKRKNCKKLVAIALISMRFNISIVDDRIEEQLEEYFEIIKK